MVHGSDGLDEATVTGPTRVSELRNGVIRTSNLDPAEFFGEVHSLEELAGGDAPDKRPDHQRRSWASKGQREKWFSSIPPLGDVSAGEKAGSVREGIEVAAECLDSRAALKKLQALIELSHN